MSFDRLARHYRWMEFVLAGEKLQRCRLAWLGEVRDSRRVLIAGEGLGRFLSACARGLPQANILCVDASAGMLARARRAWQAAGGGADRAEFQQATLPQWRPPKTAFDLVVTHFFLDCFPAATLAQVIANLAAGAKPDARWLVADFQVPPRGFSRFRAQAVLTLAYAFFQITTRLPASRLIAPDAFLERHGFRLQRRKTFDWGLLHSDIWARPCIAFPR